MNEIVLKFKPPTSQLVETVESFDSRSRLKKHRYLKETIRNVENLFRTYQLCLIEYFSNIKAEFDSLEFNEISSASTETVSEKNIGLYQNRDLILPENEDFHSRTFQFQMESLEKIRKNFDLYDPDVIDAGEAKANPKKHLRSNEKLRSSIYSAVESLIGLIQIKIDAIEGWARICPRDIYELEIRHGKQHQTLRVKIGKSLERIWSAEKCAVTFKCSILPSFEFRFREVKSNWGSFAVWSKRYVDIGYATLSIFNLLESAAKHRSMVIDVNPSGSLKLRIQCLWFPNAGNHCSITTNYFLSQKLHRPHSNSDHSSSPSSISREETRNTSYSSMKESTISSFVGINKNLARSLLTLPTSDCPKNDDECIEFERRYLSRSLSERINSNEIVEFSRSDFSTELNEMKYKISAISLKNQLKYLRDVMSTLQSCLRDYGGQTVEIELIIRSIKRLTFLYSVLLRFLHRPRSNHSKEIITDTNEKKILSFEEVKMNRMIGEAFKFLYDDDFEDSHSEKTSDSVNEQNLGASSDPHRLRDEENDVSLKFSIKSFCLTEERLTVWNIILLHHLSSLWNQLKFIGSWILKSREKFALWRLQIQRFAIDLVYEIVCRVIQDEPIYDLIIGCDTRVNALWTLLSDGIESKEIISIEDQFIFSKENVSSKINDLIVKNNLISCLEHGREDWTNFIQRTSDWFVNAMTDSFIENESNLECLTIFDIRAFFELNPYHRIDSNAERRFSSISLIDLVTIAVRVNFLLCIRQRKISTESIKFSLFEYFDADCCWIPIDLTLSFISFLYDYRDIRKSKILSNQGQNSLRLNEIKNFERIKELIKIINDWFSSLLSKPRVEIREHILIGLEAKSPRIRRAACYGISFLFKFVKRFELKNCDVPHSNRNIFLNQLVCGKESDFLWFLSIEDPDPEVREEAQNALKSMKIL
ncbi:DNA/RNA-binding protein KIN17-like [Sarcoptes scabiei]|nr:DNA/RNA-binding protein KIN17-like [Sarcoptes scabiei]